MLANATVTSLFFRHLPCSHVLAAFTKGGVDANIFISPYFNKEAWEAT
jgi:hypothetical protein